MNEPDRNSHWGIIPFIWLLTAVGSLVPSPAMGQTLVITNGIHTYSALTNTIVTLTGRSELRITAAANPIPGSQINLNSADAWLLLPNVRPSTVAASYLGQVRVNGAAAVSDGNVRVVPYTIGTMVIPHAPNYTPLQVFNGPNFLGASMSLALYTYYTDSNLGALNNAISSFKLKRGYMATLAQHPNGTGISKVYIAQDGDLEIGVLPAGLDDSISFVRVFPWRWTSKKGWAGASEPLVNPAWHYDWDNVTTSSLDVEYVPMRHNLNWNAYANINNKQKSTHALAFNEPDKSDQANMTVATAIAQWPNLLASGLRLGSPAPSDGGLSWLYDFIAQADALSYRVDYVAVHFYKGGWTASQYYNWLQGIYQQTGRPIWITEFNNGANWTCCEPTLESNAQTIGEFIDVLDNAPFVERYAIYNWVGATRELVTGGTLNPAGVVYRDNTSPLANTQELPSGGSRSIAEYRFEGNALDSSGFGNNGFPGGIPAFTTGHAGQAFAFDGVDDFVQLPENVGDCADFTFAAWIYWNGGGNWQRILDFGNGNSQYLFLTPKAGDGTQGLRFAIKNGGGEQTLETAALPANQWVHVAVTLNGDTGRLYVNGVQSAVNTGITLNPFNAATRYNYLGKSQFAADPLFHGRLDDVIVADYPLNATQIAALLTNRPPQFFSKLLSRANATPGQAYVGTLSGTATDPDAGDTLSFSKVSGPAWLNITPNGGLTGTPGLKESGTDSFTVRVTDAAGASDFALLAIAVNSQSNAVARFEFEGTTLSSVGAAHGVWTGTAAYVAGQTGQALDFDGTNHFLTLPAGLVNWDDLTVAAWVNWDGGSAWQRIFDFGNETSQNLFLTPSSGSGTLRFCIKNGTEQTIDTSALPVGQWRHVAITLGGNTGRLYVNGILAATSTAMTHNPSSFNPAHNYIGKSQWPDPLFNGRIDGFRIYNYALSSAQVASLMTNRPPAFLADQFVRGSATPGRLYTGSIVGSAIDPDGATVTYRKVSGPAWLQVASNGALNGTPGSANAGPNSFTIRASDSLPDSDDATLTIQVGGSAGLVGLYGFEGNTLNSAGPQHGVATGTPTYQAGVNGQAIDLDGAGQFVTLPAGLLNLNDVTVAARLNWDGGAAWQRILDFGNNTSQYMVLTPLSGSGTLRFVITTTGTTSQQKLETAPLAAGEWTHVAVTLGGDEGKLYVNGTLAASGTITLNPSSFNPALNYLGKSQYADPLFNGRIDEFRIYSRALSAFEVASVANPDLDSDGDGHIDTAEADADFDGDGQPNYLDPDCDNDGMPDSAETFADTDNDGILNVRDTDSDNDGLPDGWEYVYGLSPINAGDATVDSDGDRQSNAAEYVAGTLPNNATSFFDQSVQAATPFSVKVAGVAERTYTLLRAAALDSSPTVWTPVQTVGPLGSNQTIVLSDPAQPPGAAFYRTSVTAQ